MVPSSLMWNFVNLQRNMDLHTLRAAPGTLRIMCKAEQEVRTIKSLLKKAKDSHLALLTYPSTPLWNGYSLAELSMCRCLRTVPVISEQLKPRVLDYASMQAKEERRAGRSRKTRLTNDTELKAWSHCHLVTCMGYGPPVWGNSGRADCPKVLPSHNPIRTTAQKSPPPDLLSKHSTTKHEASEEDTTPTQDNAVALYPGHLQKKRPGNFPGFKLYTD